MLLSTNTALRAYLDNSTSVDIKPRVFAEWNGNSLSNSKICGTYKSIPNSISSTSLKDFTQVAPSPAPTTVTRGESTPVFNDTNAQLMIVGGRSLSSQVESKGAASGVVTLKLKSPIAIAAGDTFVVDGLGVNYDGAFVAISGTTNAVIKYNSTNNTFTATEVNVSPAGYVRISGGSYKYTHTLGTGAAAAKFYMRLKSDYTHQASTDLNFLEQFDVTIRLVGLDASGIVYTQSLTKVFSINSSDWTNAELMFANPDSPITQIEATLFFEGEESKKAALLVDRFFVQDISEYEVYISDRQPLSEVFEGDRPGDFLIDSGPQTVTIGSEVFQQQCSPVHMASSYALGDYYEKVQRSVVPFADNPYSYYTSGSDADSKKVYCIYDKLVQTNKIVIKTNSIVTKPKLNSFTVKLLIAGTWTTVVTTGAAFANNGTLVLYYNGSSWSTTRWGNGAMPQISTLTGSITSKIDIQGIAFECSELEYVNPTSKLNDAGALTFLELLELSPRLELDLTNITLNFSINKELSSDNALPLGNVTSNTASIDFSAIPVIVGDSDTRTSEENDIVPISNYSTTSPLYGMLVKGVKFKGYFDVDTTTSGVGVNGAKVLVPAFVMFAERWSENVDKVSVECFDIIKRLQSTPARPLYLENKTINEIVYSILDSVGFGDYYFQVLNNLKIVKYSGDGSVSENSILKQSVDYFWADKERSVTDTLNELFKPYQVSMYVDEYGGAVFTSLLEISNKNANNTSVVYVQDKNHGTVEGVPTNFQSNLKSIEFEDIERPEKIVMRYRRPTPSVSDFRQVRNRPNDSVVSRATDIVWEPESEAQLLTYFEVASPGILTETQNRIPFNVEAAGYINRAIENSGYLLIDEEIVYYDGLEYIFTTPSDTSFYRIEVIRSTSDIERVISEIYQERDTGDINWAPTGYMVNVQRGLFGTEPAKHIVLSPGSRTGWSGMEFNASYKGVSNIEAADGTYGAASGNIYLKSEKTSGGLMIYPSDNNKVGTKRKFFARYLINKMPSGKAGSLGVGIGVKVESGEITRGLFIWTGVRAKNDETVVTISIIQIVNGSVKVISSPKDFEFTSDLYSYEEPLELYVEFNNDMNKMKVFIGSTSLFEIVKDRSKDDDADRKVAFKTLTVDISRIDKNGLFGFAALQQGRGVLDSMAFTVNNDPRNLNSISINNSQNDYIDTDSKTNPSFYIGASNILDAIVYDQYIAGFNKFKDGFVYTGAPVARGIKIFEVDYQDFPVTSTPEVEFLGYTYTIDALRNSRIYGGAEADK
jgi:hypothetical protein